ncbi:gliding motility-associated C-terminal domain-containing protein [Nibribacter koreensis]|uniref:PKD domain-containing protein n=1 Tax=Nibribacter koreensis TaxID=1084519 RepID=A0ABP8FKW5_9BACT
MQLLPLLSIFNLFWQTLAWTPSAQPAEPPVPFITSEAVAPAAQGSLEFVENKGQWPKQVQFSAEVPGGRLFLQNKGFVYTLYDAKTLGHKHADQPKKPGKKSPETLSDDEARVKGHSYSVTFEGARATPQVKGHESTAGTRNYFLGNDPSRWGKGARGFRKVQYQNVYPGIDVALYEKAGKLKYDFYLAAGASPNKIKLTYSGASQLKLQDGHLLISTTVGNVTEQKPIAYQLVDGRRKDVPCAFVLKENTVSFQFPEGYDQKLPLVIDPVVIFSSFTGSTADNWGFTATYDSQGNMYSGGIAFKVGYPASPGAFQVNYADSVDIAIIKYNTGVSGPAARLYATYLGGRKADVPHSMVVNAKDELLILSSVGSFDFPISASAFDRTFNGGPRIKPLGSGANPNYQQGSDIAITSLSSDGSTLVASTFLGGTDNDGLLNPFGPNGNDLVQNYGDQHRGDIITDPDGNVYIASSTFSRDFPARNGFQNQYAGGTNDAVICKLTPNLSQLVWSNYYGGTGTDAAYSIQLDKNRNVYVAGGTTSAALAGTANGLQTSNSGVVDGFVLKIANTGDRILAGTFIGTDSYDQSYFLQLDGQENVYLFGQTAGNYPVTANVYNVPNGKQFIHKLNNNLNATIFSTVFGTGNALIDLSPTAFLVDECERIYICGWGGVTNAGYGNGRTFGLPTTPDAVQATTDGSDFYLMQLSPNAKDLVYATFYGGPLANEHVDGGTSRFDNRGIVYQAVCGGCGGYSDFPVPSGAHTYSALNKSTNCNNASFKFDFQTSANAGPDLRSCSADAPVLLQGTPAGGFWAGPGVSLVGGRYFFTPTSNLVGENILTYTTTIEGTNLCVKTNALVMTVASSVPHTIDAPSSVCLNGAPIVLQGSPAGGTFTVDGAVSTTFTPSTAGVGYHIITYTSTGANGFCGSVTRTIQVLPAPTLQLGPDVVLCPGNMAPLQLTATPAGGSWTGNYVTAAGVFTPPAGFTGTTQVTYTITGGCVATATKNISVAPIPTVQASLANSCQNDLSISGYAPFNAVFANTTTGSTSYLWDFGDGGTATDKTPTHTYLQPGTYTVKLTVFYGPGCQEQREIGKVLVVNGIMPNIFTPNADGINDTFVQRFSCLPTSLTVYNRWGKQVYENKDYQQNWTGDNLSEGTYFYLLKDTAGNTAKGWVEIVR